MRVVSAEIKNVKAFYERQILRFEPAFNLLMGSNNSGKSTLLDILCLRPSLTPHSSAKSIPKFGEQPEAECIASIEYETTIGELRRASAKNIVVIPLVEIIEENDGRYAALAALARDEISLSIQISFSNLGAGAKFNLPGTGVTGVGLSGGNALIQGLPCASFHYLAGAFERLDVSKTTVNEGDYDYRAAIRTGIYKFDAIRRPSQQSETGTGIDLDPGATTLAYCLNRFQASDPHGYRLFCGLVQRVLPSVKWVNSVPQGSRFNISCSPTDSSLRRTDLFVGLDQMGSGVGNILAILYVVMMSESPRVIAIDEPNAFLHPRALRELMAILESEGSQHQFFLTAHSADVLTAVRPRTITSLVADSELGTRTKQVVGRDIALLRSDLADIGVRVTDLHSKDEIIWVEGETEELVFPDLLKIAVPGRSTGIGVLRIEHTGSLTDKKRKIVETVATYQRLSQSSSLVPPMIMFVLDGDMRASIRLEEAGLANRKLFQFLDQYMIENYFLEADAIQAALNQLGEDISLEKVATTLEAARLEILGSGNVMDLNGELVLKRVFTDLTDSKQEFRKTRDVPAISTWLIENRPRALEPIVDFLRIALN